jgi:predicted small secreted protein
MSREKKRRVAVALALVGAAAGAACGNTPAGVGAASPSGGWSQQTRVPGEYLITLAAGTNAKAITDVYGRFKVKEIRDLGQNIFLVSFTEDAGPEQMEKLRTANDQIKAVQPNFGYRSLGTQKVR